MKKVALALGLTLIVVAGCGPSAQPIPPTPTSTSLPTPTPTSTSLPTPTPTSTSLPTPTPTSTSLPTPTPLPPTPTPMPPTPTLLPGTPTPVPPTPTPIVVTFDGNDCTVTGPTELPTGEHSFLLKDLSGQRQVLYVSHLLDGKTFQDMLDLQSEPGEWYPKPSWVIHPGRRPTERIAEGEHLYTFVLNKEGEHSIELYASSPRSLWFCAPLKVMEAPSE